MNWIKIINNAEKRGEFSDEEKEWAENWDTCACWNLPSKMKKDFRKKGEPTDKPLWILGGNFYQAVRFHNFEESRSIRKFILRRIKKLKEEDSKNANNI